MRGAMTNTVTVDEKNIATLEMTLKADVVKETYERTLRAYGSNVNIAGFRKGKAPRNIVEKYTQCNNSTFRYRI